MPCIEVLEHGTRLIRSNRQCCFCRIETNLQVGVIEKRKQSTPLISRAAFQLVADGVKLPVKPGERGKIIRKKRLVLPYT